jgi:hypothetical protein
MAAMHDERPLIKTPLEELLIGLDDEARRNAPVRVSQHPLGGDDGEAFDAKRPDHGDADLATSA